MNNAKRILKLCDKLCVFGQNVKTQQQKNKQIKTLAGAGN